MDAIDELLEWATSNGIILDGIAAKAIPGRGIGIVATRPLVPDQIVLTVPTTTLRSISNTPKPLTRALKGATVQAILSASLSKDTTSSLAKWKAIFPSKQDVQTSMPLCWPSDLQELLPLSAEILLTKQKTNYGKDWAAVVAAWPDFDEEEYKYAWLLVNSRTFYHTTARTKKLPKTDHMVLQPVADLFNHVSDDTACHVEYDDESYTITTTSSHKAGDELFIRYGAHGNDFLLVEYGFTLPLALNRWDEVCLDPYLCPIFSARKRTMLEDAGFWGGYKVDSETACYRTQIALRAQCLPEKQLRAVLDGQRDEDEDQDVVDEELFRVLRVFEKDIRSKLAKLDRTKTGEVAMRESLRQRWLQIKEIVTSTMSRLQG